MRVLYPDNINEEIDKLAQYMTFDKKTRKMVPQDNAPADILQRLDDIRKKCDEIERR